MQNAIERIDALDISLFGVIHSQTTDEEKKSLLAIQRATANTYGNYTYLEIGSHLGGSIQPYLVDERCTTIYSIDPRPDQQPDDQGVPCNYQGNSTERMLNLLKTIDSISVPKVKCFDMDSSVVDVAQITPSPQLAFIDGEHTVSAVLSDFQFCKKAVTSDGVIIFHDFQIIFSAIKRICDVLKKQNTHFVAMKLDGSVFGIFFNTSIVYSDPFLAATYDRNQHSLNNWQLQAYGLVLRRWLRNNLPSIVLRALRKLRNLFQK